MNTQELITRVKFRLDDKTTPRAFKDEDILLALNDAQNEFALRTLCIFDGEDNVQVTAQNPWVQLPVGTCWVTAAWLDDSPPLRLVTQHELEFGYFDLNGEETSIRHSNWRTAEGQPQFLLTDLGPQQARFIPRPTTGGTLYLERYRLPDTAMTVNVAPEIPAPYHADLVIGALAYLFNVPDLETTDKELAFQNQQRWEGRLQIAEQLLQTSLRVPMRVVNPPPGTVFAQPISNMIGTGQNVNTEN